MMISTDQKIGRFNITVNEVPAVDMLNLWNLWTKGIVRQPPTRFTIYLPFGPPKASVLWLQWSKRSSRGGTSQLSLVYCSCIQFQTNAQKGSQYHSDSCLSHINTKAEVGQHWRFKLDSNFLLGNNVDPKIDNFWNKILSVDNKNERRLQTERPRTYLFCQFELATYSDDVHSVNAVSIILDLMHSQMTMYLGALSLIMMVLAKDAPLYSLSHCIGVDICANKRNVECWTLDVCYGSSKSFVSTTNLTYPN